MKFSSVDSRRTRATTIEINEQRLLTIFLVTIEQWIHYKTDDDGFGDAVVDWSRLLGERKRVMDEGDEATPTPPLADLAE